MVIPAPDFAARVDELTAAAARLRTVLIENRPDGQGRRVELSAPARSVELQLESVRRGVGTMP